MKNVDDMFDNELESLYLEGENLHIYSSRASRAKRLLDLRREKHHEELSSRAHNLQLEVAEKQKEAAERIIGNLDYFKNNWFVKKPWYIQMGIFLLYTVILGLSLNIAAAYITLFLFHWK